VQERLKGASTKKILFYGPPNALKSGVIT